MENLWKRLKNLSNSSGKAFTVLAPMEDVTDTVFRQVVLSQGRPDLFMTEFTNCDGLQSRGREHVIHRLAFTPDQHPIVAQIWGRKPETYLQTIPLIADLGFDGVDINMGCPVPNVIRGGAGSGLIKNPENAVSIITKVREAISNSSNPNMAFSVKTRIGFNEIQQEWVELLLHQPIDALILHLRTTKELSKVPAHWEIMNEFIQMRNSINSSIALVGNGDITTKNQIATYKELYGVDGVMIGRGIFNNLWLFNPDKDDSTMSSKERILALRKHIELFDIEWKGKKNFEVIKKFFKVYLKNFEGAADLRSELIVLKKSEEMLPVIDRFVQDIKD